MPRQAKVKSDSIAIRTRVSWTIYVWFTLIAAQRKTQKMLLYARALSFCFDRRKEFAAYLDATLKEG